MDFSFINYVSNKDFDLHEIRVSSLGKERKSTNIIPVVSDLTDLTRRFLGDKEFRTYFLNPVKKIDDYVLGFQKLFKLIIGPTKKAAVDTFKSMRDYATCNDEKEKSRLMKDFLTNAEELTKLVIINPIFTIAPTEAAFVIFAEKMGVKPTWMDKLVFAFITKIPYYIYVYILPMLDTISKNSNNPKIKEKTKRISVKIKEYMPKTAFEDEIAA
jgi:hypothetical protein